MDEGFRDIPERSKPAPVGRHFNQLTRQQQAEAVARATQKVWAELQESVSASGTIRFNFTGEEYEREDVEKVLQAAIEPWRGSIADDFFWDQIASSSVGRVVAEEASRRVHRQRYVIVPRDVVVLRDE